MLSILLKLKRLKHIFFIVVCLSVNLHVSAQGRMGYPIPRNLIKCITSQKGVLYSGIDNIIVLDSSIVAQSDNIEVSITHGAALRDSANLFIVFPDRPGKIRLSLKCMNGQDTILYGYKYYMAHSIPDPLLTLDGQPIQTQTALPKRALLTCDSLGVYFSKDIIGSENWMVVTEFQLGYSYGGFYVSHKNEGNKLSIRTKEILSTLGPDREISIRPRVKAMGNVQKELPIYRITIY